MFTWDLAQPFPKVGLAQPFPKVSLAQPFLKVARLVWLNLSQRLLGCSLYVNKDVHV